MVFWPEVVFSERSWLTINSLNEGTYNGASSHDATLTPPTPHLQSTPLHQLKPQPPNRHPPPPHHPLPNLPLNNTAPPILHERLQHLHRLLQNPPRHQLLGTVLDLAARQDHIADALAEGVMHGGVVAEVDGGVCDAEEGGGEDVTVGAGVKGEGWVVAQGEGAVVAGELAGGEGEGAGEVVRRDVRPVIGEEGDWGCGGRGWRCCVGYGGVEEG